MPHPNPVPAQHRPQRNLWRGISLFTAFCILGTVLALAGCGATPPGAGGAASSDHPTGISSKAQHEAECSREAVLAAVPTGATMQKFECARTGDTEWAAAQVEPGNTVFFLRWHGGAWNAEDADSVCGSTSAGLPPELRPYCTTTSPSPAPSRSPRRPTTPPRPTPTPPTTATCTTASLLVGLPHGSRMQKFTCADVNGKRWAAARVDPAETVFFLQSDGRRWTAQDSDNVCGAASAGLPPSLLAYCR